MTAFANIEDLTELKRTYRRLAAQWHPDRGGDATMMQKINAQYDWHRARLGSLAPLDAGIDFSFIEVGYTVWVNGTECEVTVVSSQSFQVVAKGRSRQAVFDRSSGTGKYNHRLKASFDNRHARAGRTRDA